MSQPIFDIIIEHINERFARGKYGEFDIIIMRRNGYVNATKLCVLANKRFDNWLRLETSKELIKEIENSIPQIRGIEIIKGGSKFKQELCGTYVHPLLIPHIASWCSAKFAIKVSRIVNEAIAIEHRNQLKLKDSEIDELKNLIKNMNLKLDNQTAKLDNATKLIENQTEEIKESKEIMLEQTEQIKEIKDTLEIVTDNYVVPVVDVGRGIENKNIKEFVVILRNDNDSDKFYFIRRQRLTINIAIKRRKQEIPTSIEFMRIENPNSVNLLHRIKEILKYNIKFKQNEIILINIKPNEFKEKVLEIDQQRKNI